MRAILIFLLATVLTVFAKEKPASILGKMPETLGGFERTKVHSYDEPGLGASVAYRKPGIVVTVYVFDRDAASVKAGLEDPLVQSEIKKASAEIEAAKQAGSYTKVTSVPVGDEKTSFGTKHARFILVRNFDPDKGLEVFSEIHVFGAHDHIIKLRLSCSMEDEKKHREALDKFLPLLVETARKGGIPKSK